MRNDYNIGDEQFEQETEPFYELVKEYIEEVIIYEYLAYYLANKFNMNVMWSNSLLAHINSALDCLCEINEIDLDKLNSTLKEKYSLLITNEKPLQIKKCPPPCS